MVSKSMKAAEVAVINVLRLIRQVVAIFKTLNEFHDR
jgi:hypothetical protein